MNISAIILSNTIDKKRYDLACETIRTLTESTDWYGDIYVIETQAEKHMIDNNYTYEWEQVKVIHPNKKFNYNQFLNIGIAAARETADWFLICNNDLEFSKDWLVETKLAHKKVPDIASFSFYCPSWENHNRFTNNEHKHLLEVGYVPMQHICGWCLLISKECIDICNLFDERFPMYWQDNDYAFTIHDKGVRHALICTAVVEHACTQSYDIAMQDPRLCSGIPAGLIPEKFPEACPNEHFISGAHLRPKEIIDKYLDAHDRVANPGYNIIY